MSLCPSGDSNEQSEIYSIDKELEQLSDIKRELQERQDKILHANDQGKTSRSTYVASMMLLSPHTANSKYGSV